MSNAPPRPTSRAPRARRPRSIRAHLIGLVLGALASLVAVAAIALAVHVGLERRATEERLIAMARAIALTADREGAFAADRLGEPRAGRGLAEGWTVSLFDRSGAVIAHAPTRTGAGRPASPELRALIAAHDQGWLRPAWFEPSPVYYAFARSPLSGQTVALGIPAGAEYAGARRWLLLACVGAAAVAVISLAMAGILGRRIAGALYALPAGGHARGGPAAGEASSGIAEVEDLRQSLAAKEARERDAVEREHRAAEQAMASLAVSKERMRRLLEQAQAARAEAESANHQKDEFMATLSHELRTPLHAIIGWLSLLRSNLDAAQQEHALAVIERNVQAQAFLIRDLLDIGRGDRGPLTLEPAWADLSRVVTDACEALQPSAEGKGVRLECSAGPAHPALIDAGRMQQVVWNLVTNALRFTPLGGRVDVVLERRANGGSRLSVTDTGLGIPREQLPHIFERSRRGLTPGADASHGLGLGLGIVKRIVERHGGSVRADSEGFGAGATFTVDLPGAVPPPGQESAPQRSDATTGASARPTTASVS